MFSLHLIVSHPAPDVSMNLPIHAVMCRPSCVNARTSLPINAGYGHLHPFFTSVTQGRNHEYHYNGSGRS